MRSTSVADSSLSVIEVPLLSERRNAWSLITRWDVWGLPRAALFYVATVIAAAIAVSAALMAHSFPVTDVQWCVAVLLLLCAAVMQLRQAKEDRNSRHRTLMHDEHPHLDSSSVWFLPMALVLPPPVAIVVILIGRGITYLTAKPEIPHRFVLSTAARVLSAMAAAAVLKLWGVQVWQLAAETVPDGALSWERAESLAVTLVVVGIGLTSAAVVMGAIEMLVIAGVITLTVDSHRRTRRRLWGSREQNVAEMCSLLLGAVVAALVTNPAVPLVLGLVMLGKWLNMMPLMRDLQQRARQLENEMAAASVSATTDPLTGLANRLHWDAALAELVDRKQPAFVITFDLDRFKKVNDSEGHTAGDQAIQHCARVLQETIGKLWPGAVIARVGGDEFWLLLPDRRSPDRRPMTVIDGLRIADIIRRRMAEADVHIHVPGSQPKVLPPITISGGVALLPDCGATVEAITEAADQAALAAKARRNQVCPASLVVDREEWKPSLRVYPTPSSPDPEGFPDVLTWVNAYRDYRQQEPVPSQEQLDRDETSVRFVADCQQIAENSVRA
ncbi:GGDEF domain-containing protein [Pseudonocardiaceae bacterium YIM PH 21723]|nr:GGDEF domain-containing protein [Pseudonocardiaceae bacterium YIM PH 21723]